MNLEYQALRTLVDSWGLLAMVVFFVVAAGFAFRPGSSAAQKDAANIPFKED
jgi:cytochrome c oxidase cbb3-type subunit 4